MNESVHQFSPFEAWLEARRAEGWSFQPTHDSVEGGYPQRDFFGTFDAPGGRVGRYRYNEARSGDGEHDVLTLDARKPGFDYAPGDVEYIFFPAYSNRPAPPRRGD